MPLSNERDEISKPPTQNTIDLSRNLCQISYNDDDDDEDDDDDDEDGDDNNDDDDH